MENPPFISGSFHHFLWKPLGFHSFLIWDPVKILYIWVVAIVVAIAFGGALLLSRALWKSAYSRSNMKPKSIPKQARKWIEQLFCWFSGASATLHVPFVLHLFACIFLHVHAFSFHCAFISFHFPFMFLSFMSIYSPFIVLSFSFQCAFVSSHRPFICSHFPFIVHSCPFIS